MPTRPLSSNTSPPIELSTPFYIFLAMVGFLTFLAICMMLVISAQSH